MSDFLLENDAARRLIKTLGLPVPTPARLSRERGPWCARPLDDAPVVVAAAPGGQLGAAIAQTLVQAGAMPQLATPELAPAFGAPSEAYGRPLRILDPAALPDAARFHAIVFDATGCAVPSDLRSLYDAFHPFVRKLRGNGRIVVLGRPATGEDPATDATRTALEGFVRSLAKEVGRFGSTAHLLRVGIGAEAGLEGPLRFLLSRRSAFVSGQVLEIMASASEAAPWVRSLAGKVALVTGAARGIGAATARRLALEGAHVVCLDRPADGQLASTLAREIHGTTLLSDVAAPEAAATIANTLQETFGGVDIVVHNAGITRDKSLAHMKEDAWDLTLGINLGAVVAITDALLAGTLRDRGRIVLLSSVTGIAGNRGQTNYSASKAGLLGYARSLDARLRPRGITVNAIAPGFIETRLTAAIPLAMREAARRLSNLGQGGLPEDVADAITFLATPHAYGVHAQVIRVCGGALLGA